MAADVPPVVTALEPELEPEPDETAGPVLEAPRFTSQTQDYESLRKLKGIEGDAGDFNADRQHDDNVLSAKPPASYTRTATLTRREYHFTSGGPSRTCIGNCPHTRCRFRPICSTVAPPLSRGQNNNQLSPNLPPSILICHRCTLQNQLAPSLSR